LDAVLTERLAMNVNGGLNLSNHGGVKLRRRTPQQSCGVFIKNEVEDLRIPKQMMSLDDMIRYVAKAGYVVRKIAPGAGR
jgi:hypothetical protein